MKVKADVAALGAVATLTATAILYMFATFATAAEVDDIRLNLAYGQFYERLKDYNGAKRDGNHELAQEYKHEMERLKATICRHNPNWERCKRTEDG